MPLQCRIRMLRGLRPHSAITMGQERTESAQLRCHYKGMVVAPMENQAVMFCLIVPIERMKTAGVFSGVRAACQRLT